MTAPNILIELQNVERHFRQAEQRVEVLRGASLALREGELTALVGPSGCGKSTLLNLAGLLEKPDGGDVLIDGKSTVKLGQRAAGKIRRNNIGFVFQFHRLLAEFSAVENIMIPQMLNGFSRSEASDRAEQLLAMVGLADRHAHRPGTLSGGEQQRVAVARAVANAPRILLADEPTGNLDPGTASDVFEHISNIVHATQTAALIVTHNQQLASKMDRVLTIKNGIIQNA
ncbi:ABC transporter ATP-binding protein [Alphaproteobacteria bacterium]|jgi:lipoprotein-releasing system ATP-binding protein|nr:ABC transporter ATP-binding protein [Alphaproteobacteria bacterium]